MQPAATGPLALLQREYYYYVRCRFAAMNFISHPPIPGKAAQDVYNPSSYPCQCSNINNLQKNHPRLTRPHTPHLLNQTRNYIRTRQGTQ